MAKIALSDAKLRSLKPPEKGQFNYWDKGLAGFGVRLSQGGSRTFVLKHRNQYITLGRHGIVSLSEARTEAKRLLAEFTLGKVRPQSITYPQATSLFLEEKARTKKPRTVAEYKRLLSRFPFKGQLADISHGEFLRRLNRFGAEGERSHLLVVAKVFFRWCIKRRYITDDPTSGLSQKVSPPRERVLSDTELKAIWQGLDRADLPPHYATVVRLLICTGQRRGEIAALKPAYISSGQCELPKEIVKNNRSHVFPLGTLAQALLAEPLAKAANPDALLFSARGKPHKPLNAWSKPKQDLDTVCGVKDWTLHDLRRTFATRLAELGTPIHVVEKLLNHVSGTTGGLVGVYQKHQWWPEQVQAVSAWEARLEALLRGNKAL